MVEVVVAAAAAAVGQQQQPMRNRTRGSGALLRLIGSPIMTIVLIAYMVGFHHYQQHRNQNSLHDHPQSSLNVIGMNYHDDDRRRRRTHSALADGCYHVFIDAGSNRGVHGRFLFEPDKYPKSSFTKKFDDMFGHNRTLQNICVFAFEPNVDKHSKTQLATQAAYASAGVAGGWRYHYLPFGVSDEDAQVTFYRNWNYYNGAKREEWGFGTHAHGAVNDSMEAAVATIDLAAWCEQHVFDRIVPPKNEYNRAHPVVAIKMDVEGSEYRTLHHMMETGTACKFDYIVGELHYTDIPQVFGPYNLTTQQSVEWYATKVMKKRLSQEGCPTFIEFDDEEYLHDGQPYPVPGNQT